MIEKANQKYDGNIGRVTDFLRMRVIAETTDEAELVAQAIHKKFPSIDSNLQVNPHGYRDRKLNIVFKDKDGEEIVAEISIGPSGHQVAAENNHGFYEEWRALATQYQGQKKLPEVVDATMDEITKYFEWEGGPAVIAKPDGADYVVGFYIKYDDDFNNWQSADGAQIVLVLL